MISEFTKDFQGRSLALIFFLYLYKSFFIVLFETEKLKRRSKSRNFFSILNSNGTGLRGEFLEQAEGTNSVELAKDYIFDSFTLFLQNHQMGTFS